MTLSELRAAVRAIQEMDISLDRTEARVIKISDKTAAE
jgi:hypothetical protein